MRKIFPFLSRVFGHMAQVFGPTPTVRTFTYFVPAPRDRKTGYREKQFDMVTTRLLSQGAKIISMKTQACTGSLAQGMWVICVLEIPHGQELMELDENGLELPDDPALGVGDKIDGLYYIKEQS